MLNSKSGAVGARRLLHNSGELTGEVCLIGEAAVEADVCKGISRADDEVAGFLDAEVTEVFLGRHIKAGFKFTKEAREGKVGHFCELGDGDVIAVPLVEEFKGGAEFFVFCEGGSALIEGAGDANNSTDFTALVEDWLLGGGRPIDEAISSRDELDPVDDRFSTL